MHHCPHNECLFEEDKIEEAVQTELARRLEACHKRDRVAEEGAKVGVGVGYINSFYC